MKKLLLISVLIAGSMQAADGVWTKKVGNVSGCGNCLITSGSVGYAIFSGSVSYQYFVNHKLVATVTKDSDDLYSLCDKDGKVKDRYDDLAAAKADGAKLEK